jgi:aminoglycoside phosphotransferase (APT) family kinase protein
MITDLPGLPALPARRWLLASLPDLDPADDWDAAIVSGGLSNITYRLRIGPRSYILRRPPLGHVLPRAHDMVREFRILAALWPTVVPVPEPLALCTDPDVIGAPFYVMPEVAGRVLRSAADTGDLDPQTCRQIAEALIRTLADLHAVDADAVGLGDYGRRGGYSARQIRTWTEQWNRSRTRELPDMDALLSALRANIPSRDETAVVHGDFRLDNTIVDVTGQGRIAAVLDWELSTLGDPLADLGLLLTYWHDRDDDERAQIAVAAGITTRKGFPTADQLAHRYASITGRPLDELPFYSALGAMKLAVILEGVHGRHLTGTTVSDGYDNVGSAVPILVARGLRTLHARRH